MGFGVFDGRAKVSTAAMKKKWTCRGRMAPRKTDIQTINATGKPKAMSAAAGR